MEATSYSHIQIDPAQGACLLRHPRIRVIQLAMDYLAHGWSVEEMCRQHPYLSLAEAHSAMAYYFDHQEQMDADIRKEWLQIQGQAIPVSPTLLMRLCPRKAV